MLTSLKVLKGYKVRAIDGDLGGVHDFYFDDVSWRMRFIVVDTGNWLTGRKVLLSAGVFGDPDGTDRVIPVSLSTDQVKDSPDVNTEQPVSKQRLQGVFAHYGWPLYWEPAGSLAAVAAPPEAASELMTEDYDQHLQSFLSVTGLEVMANDGPAGTIQDFVYDHSERVLRYVVADTTSWTPGGAVILTVDAVKALSWSERRLYVDHTREEVKGSPEFAPLEPLSREHEENIYQHYRRRPYWII